MSRELLMSRDARRTVRESCVCEFSNHEYISYIHIEEMKTRYLISMKKSFISEHKQKKLSPTFWG